MDLLEWMHWWIWPLAAVAMVLVLALLVRLLGRPKPPYQKRPSLMSASELAFFRVLEEAAGEEHYIFTKVRIADLIAVAPGTRHALGWFARIGQKHVDYVLAHRQTLEPLLAVELDDRSHERPDRRERDRFVEAAMSAAGLPLLRVKVARNYNTSELAAAVAQSL